MALPPVLDERRRMGEEMEAVEAEAKEAEDLEARIAELELDRKTIEDIFASRWLWAEKLSQVIDVIPHYVQISSLAVVPRRSGGRGMGTGPEIIMDCICAGDQESNIARYGHRPLRGPFWDDVLDMPEWSYTVDHVDGIGPVLKFRARFVLKPRVRVPREKPRMKPPKRPLPHRAPVGR
jgi:hypothetical protein